MTARLPSIGGDANNWGTILNDYLQQALNADGTLVTATTNTYTGSANTNLASTAQAGLVKLAGDLAGGTALVPTVTGIQGRTIASTAPNNGQVLTWDNASSSWKPVDAPGAGTGLTLAQALTVSSLRI